MAWSSRIRTALVLWCLAEAVIFAALVHVVGLGPVMLAELVTGLVGVALLRRTGAAALIRLRNAFRATPGATGGDVVDGGLSVLGALAILLPGFLSDVVGLVLLVRPLRVGAARLIARRGWIRTSQRRNPRPGVVDLERGDWRSVDGTGPGELPRR